jgi:hypothetical protein
VLSESREVSSSILIASLGTWWVSSCTKCVLVVNIGWEDGMMCSIYDWLKVGEVGGGCVVVACIGAEMVM